MTDPKYQHGSSEDGWMKQTDTPRTETYVLNPHPQAVPAEFARELERELNASQAEVERLREQLASTKQLAIKFWEALEKNGFKLELPK
jgi:hypothetical protein